MVANTPRSVVPHAKMTPAICSRLSDLLGRAADEKMWGKVTVEVHIEEGQVRLVHATTHETIRPAELTA